MSAIGNYVHYNATNYVKYGTTKKTKTSTISELNEVKNYIFTTVKSASLNEMDLELLNQQFNDWNWNLQNVTAEEANKYRSIITQKMMDKYGAGLVLDFETGAVSGLNVNDAIEHSRKIVRDLSSKTETKAKEQTLTKIQTVQNRFADAFKAVEKVTEANTKEELKSKLKNLQEQFKQACETNRIVIEKGNRETVEYESEGQTKVKYKYSSVNFGEYLPRHGDGGAQSFVDEINAIMGAVKILDLPQAAGEFLEWIGEVSYLLSLKEGVDSICDTLQNMSKTKGSSKTSTNFSEKDLIKLSQTAAKEISKNSRITKMGVDSKYYWNLNYSSAQKADAFMQVEQNGETTNIGISLKNYNLSKSQNRNITIVSGIPLLSLFLGIGKKNNSTNHILNLFAFHPEEPMSFKALRKIGEDILAMYILYNGLTGKGSGKTGGFADIFAVNDSSKKGGVKFYSITNLIDKIITSDNFNMVHIVPDINNIELKNVYVDAFSGSKKARGAAVQARISKLIASAHAIKIHASLNSAILT